MPTAIVTGATGMTGHAIVEALLKDNAYTKIYTLSRSQQRSSHSKVEHATLDLQSSAQEMSKSLSHIEAVDYVFFCAYLARDDEGEAAKVNCAMLKNFIDALDLTGQTKSLKRFILTCGLKQYGVHLGQPKNPMLEDEETAWLEQSDRPPNFYYDQQRLLKQKAQESKSGWTWVATYPQDVIGMAKANFMNLATALGLYCAVSKALPDSELVFPGNKINYLAFNNWTSADLHARFCLWAANAPNAGNNAFNVVNGDTQSWQDMWPRLAMRWGCKVPENMFPNGQRGEYPGYESTGMELHPRPPVAEVEAKIGLKGEFKPSYVHQQIDTTAWSKKPEVVKAWESLRDKYGLEQEAWDKATWGFLTFLLGREYSCIASMSKARRFGWTGYADTWEEFEKTFKELEEAKMLPPIADMKKS